MATYLPPELLTEIFNYVENNDYKTLYSCILLNKQWHIINIPNLWRNPFYSTGSTKILINCLLVDKDKDFLTKNNIQLNFKLLEKSPLYNYAKFMTQINFKELYFNLSGLLSDDCGIHFLEKRLIEFVLDNSTTIRKLINFKQAYELLIIDHNRFNVCFQNLQVLSLDIYNQSFVLDLSDFIKINGKSFKDLIIRGRPSDIVFLGVLIQSIGQNCKNIEYLEVFYYNEINQELTCIFDNCIKLKHITLCALYSNYTIDGNDILKVLNQTSPKNLNTIQLNGGEITYFHSNVLDNLMNNWKGLKPLRIEFSKVPKSSSVINQLKKYQDLGFLKIIILD